MYHKLLEKKKTGLFEFADNRIFGLTNVDGNLRLAEFSDDFEIKWLSIDYKVYNFVLFENSIIYTVYKGKTVSLDIRNYTVKYELQEPIAISKRSLEKDFYYSHYRGIFMKFDLKNGNFIRVSSKELFHGLFKTIDNCLLHHKSGVLRSFNKSNFSLLWQKDFSNLAEYIELDGEEVLGDIRQLWNYNGHVMVLTQMFIFKLNSETGEIIHQKKLPAGFMELCVNENKAYGCYGYHFIEIDLDTLRILSFERIEYENYEGQELFTLMNKAIYDEGLVFHAVRLEGGLHCVGAIQPKTGERIWLHPIGVNDISSIAFHNNKMFVHDIGSTLHIFERNTKL